MLYKWPTILKKGGTIGVITLGSPDASNNMKLFMKGLMWLKSRGFSIKLGKYVTNDKGFLAGTPEELVEDLNNFLIDPEVDFIMTTSGGDNCNSLLDKLDYNLFSKSNKGLMSLSNPTVLLNALTFKSKIITFHGPTVVWGLGRTMDSYTTYHMIHALNQTLPFKISPTKWKWLNNGECIGSLFGGNIWSLQQLIGTSWEPNWNNSILFIEDVSTQYHQIDAMLTHFDHTGIFSKISGLIIGVFEDCKEEDYNTNMTIEDIIMKIVNKYNFPVVSRVHLGHTPKKITLPIGATLKMNSFNNSLEIIN